MTDITAFDRVTVFGGITIDRMARTEAPPVLGASNPGSVRTSPGGVGFNIAASLARLGLKTRLVAIVGADAEGEAALAAAKGAGIDTSATAISRFTPTATYQAALDDAGEIVIGVSDMRIYDELGPAAVATAVAGRETDGFWVLDANLPLETIDFLVHEAAAVRRPVAGLAVSPAKAVRFAALTERLTYLFANRREAAAILGRPSNGKLPSAAGLAADLYRSGSANVVVTDAIEPLSAMAGGHHRSFAPLKAAVRTVNGAGDALAAGTIYGLSEGRGLFEALRFGLALGALTVESDETARSDLTPSLLLERIGAGMHA